MGDNQSLEVKVEGLDELIKKLGAIGALETLEPPMTENAFKIARWSKQNRLSGPRPMFLGVKTGRLRSSISVARSATRGNFEFYIGTNVEYARMHELGFRGMVHVPAHIRRFKQRVSFKRWVASSGSFVAEEKRFTRKAPSGFAYVSPYGYLKNYHGKPFLRPAIEDSENINQLTEDLNNSIKKALEKA